MTTVISAKLSLVLRLLDTTTGREIAERNIQFFIDGEYVIPMVKEESLYVFVNLCKEDFLMQINVFGYDRLDMQVNTTVLDPMLPMMDVFLMPSEKNHTGGDVLEITGTLSGLEYIEAINLNRPICIFRSEEKKKDTTRLNLLPLVPGGGVRLDRLKYALLAEADGRYDCFTVKKQDSPTSVILEDSLQNEHRPNGKIYRIIYGRAGPGDRFTLKVRDGGVSLPHMIHFGLDGKEYFRKLDLHLEAGEVDLFEGMDEVEPIDRKEEETDE